MPLPSHTERRYAGREVRGVSGWGPRCGCGGMSQLHLAGERPTSPETSTFLCARCVVEAVDLLLAQRPDQPSYWPGDEDRDERYVDPRATERGGT